MGEIADMMLDGTCCQACGVFIGESGGLGQACGVPRFCRDCGGDKECVGVKRLQSKRKKSRGGVGEVRCPKCGKRFKTEQGVADHTRDVHEGRRVNGRILSREELNERDYDWANNQTTIEEEQDWGA